MEADIRYVITRSMSATVTGLFTQILLASAIVTAAVFSFSFSGTPVIRRLFLREYCCRSIVFLSFSSSCRDKFLLACSLTSRRSATSFVKWPNIEGYNFLTSFSSLKVGISAFTNFSRLFPIFVEFWTT